VTIDENSEEKSHKIGSFYVEVMISGYKTMSIGIHTLIVYLYSCQFAQVYME